MGSISKSWIIQRTIRDLDPGKDPRGRKGWNQYAEKDSLPLPHPKSKGQEVMAAKKKKEKEKSALWSCPMTILMALFCILYDVTMSSCLPVISSMKSASLDNALWRGVGLGSGDMWWSSCNQGRLFMGLWLLIIAGLSKGSWCSLPVCKLNYKGGQIFSALPI